MMKNTRLGCFTTSGILTAVLTTLIISGFALAQGGLMFNPGALNARTGALLGGMSSHAEIAGRCNLCHAPFWSATTMADRCVACHTDVATQWQDLSALHGLLRKNNPDLTCRVCHPDHRGPDSPLIDLSNASFPHNSFGFLLTGHQVKTDGSPFGCNDCHAQVYTSFNQAICTTCHTQIEVSFIHTHIQDFGRTCLACHDGLDTYGFNFDHDNLPFQLTGKHAQVQCAQCHVNARSIADLIFTPQNCDSCHSAKDTHQGRLGTDCGSCHTTVSWTQATFDHDLSTFKLDGKHVNVACKNCHINQVLQGTPTDCNSCHAAKDSHQGNLGTACGKCHTTAGWTPATYDHNLSFFKLTGKHATIACTNCHINKVFDGTPTDCYSCHQKNDNHNGQFGTNCGSCHSTSGWTPASFDHNLSTFKLTGQHVNTACMSCHINNVFHGTPTNCYSCHVAKDAHGGQFGTDCGSCHSTSGWTPASFDHSRSGFALTGAHTGLNCTQCHSGGVYSGLSTACVACHTEPAVHAGVFGTDCAQCHNTSNWNASFSHSGFPLTGAHANLSCTQCHANGVYNGLSTACVACHAEPAVHAGVFGTECAQCHNTSNWNASFSHPGGCKGNCATHQKATCADCHPFNFSTATCTKCHDSNNPGGD